MNLLLISNSTNYGEAYLQHARPMIKDFLGNQKINAIFIPYAGVTVTWDDYYAKVNKVFEELGYAVSSIHMHNNVIEAVNKANCIIIGGGNTFHLAHLLHNNELLPVIKAKVLAGTPYIGWSAGSNVACPTIKTTNDMPIIEPKSFNVLGLVPFQINPHYTDFVQPNHAGETREQRLQEFMKINQDVTVVGLREATALQINNNKVKLLGPNAVRIMKYNTEAKEYKNNDNLDFLLNTVA